MKFLKWIISIYFIQLVKGEKSSEKMEKLMLKQENLKRDISLNVELDDINMFQPTSNYTDLWVIIFYLYTLLAFSNFFKLFFRDMNMI